MPHYAVFSEKWRRFVDWARVSQGFLTKYLIRKNKNEYNNKYTQVASGSEGVQYRKGNTR